MATTIPEPDLQAAQTVWSWLSLYDPVTPADVIVGLGSSDKRVATRCAELHQLGLAPRVLFTGQEGNFTKGRFTQTEARTFADVAIAAGTPPDAITLEEKATNTGENIRFAALMLPGVSRVIFVSKPHMQRRVRATVRSNWPDVTGIFSAPVLCLETEATADFPLDALIHKLTGAMERMLTYPELGFQAPEPAPHTVHSAHRHLIRAGYTAYLP